MSTLNKNSILYLDELNDDELLMLNCVNKKGEMDEHYTVNWKKARFIEKVAYPAPLNNRLILTAKGKRLLETYRLSKKYSIYNYRRSHIEDIIYYYIQLINEKNLEKKRQLIHDRINENITQIDDILFNELYESASTYYCVNAIKNRELQLQGLDEQLKVKESIEYLMNLEDQLNNKELMLQIVLEYYKVLKSRIN